LANTRKPPPSGVVTGAGSRISAGDTSSSGAASDATVEVSRPAGAPLMVTCRGAGAQCSHMEASKAVQADADASGMRDNDRVTDMATGMKASPNTMSKPGGGWMYCCVAGRTSVAMTWTGTGEADGVTVGETDVVGDTVIDTVAVEDWVGVTVAVGDTVAVGETLADAVTDVDVLADTVDEIEGLTVTEMVGVTLHETVDDTDAVTLDDTEGDWLADTDADGDAVVLTVIDEEGDTALLVLGDALGVELTEGEGSGGTASRHDRFPAACWWVYMDASGVSVAGTTLKSPATTTMSDSKPVSPVRRVASSGPAFLNTKLAPSP